MRKSPCRFNVVAEQLFRLAEQTALAATIQKKICSLRKGTFNLLRCSCLDQKNTSKVPLRVRRAWLQLQASQIVPEEGEEEVLLQGQILRPRGRPLPAHHRGTAGPAHILPGPGRGTEAEETVTTISPD